MYGCMDVYIELRMVTTSQIIATILYSVQNRVNLVNIINKLQ